MIDNYTLRARFYPVVILFFPFVILGVGYSIQYQSFMHAISSLGVASLMIYLASQLGRDLGKLKEPKLWGKWGGSLTTQLLRLRDDRLDRFTKARYHNKLQSLCPVIHFPDISLEESDPTIADDIYRTWTKFLISKTRDGKTFNLLLKENTSYGFRRNLWGLKPVSITLLLILLIGNYAFYCIKNGTTYPLLFPLEFIYVSIALLLLLMFWIFIVTRNWVKVPSLAYAERLLEATEIIN